MTIISDSFLAVIPICNPSVTFVEMCLNLSIIEMFGCHILVQGIVISCIDKFNRLHYSSLFPKRGARVIIIKCKLHPEIPLLKIFSCP